MVILNLLFREFDAVDDLHPAAPPPHGAGVQPQARHQVHLHTCHLLTAPSGHLHNAHKAAPPQHDSYRFNDIFFLLKN